VIAAKDFSLAVPKGDGVKQKIKRCFETVFGKKAAFIIRAPGRVNLIGGHTDYNQGYVLPMAIDRWMWIAARPRSDEVVSCWSMDFKQKMTFNLQNFSKGGPRWGEYLKGVSWALQEKGYSLTGWDAVISGDIPIGAGLSSSAALEMATARTHVSISGFPWNPIEAAKMARHAENHWVGVSCGIMDQLISAVGKRGHGLLIDCRSLDIDAIPLPPQASVVVLDTSTRRELVISEYDQRAEECARAAAFFGQEFLRDVAMKTLVQSAKGLDPCLMRRARHVISENQRTLEAAEAMKARDAIRLGELMGESHHSLRDDFEVSSEMLNCMADLAVSDPACLGARMTGAGFGGCVIALVKDGMTDEFATRMRRVYQRESGLIPKVYVCRASNGVEVVEALV
jgi:galactokinase